MSNYTDKLKKLLNGLNIGIAHRKGGDFIVDQATRTGTVVPDAAGAAPTAAEFKALLDSLRTAKLIASV
ncbi:hypothetical protein [Pseudomonas sp.]|uniref:hypothetical protein n=1 Tax=Pseudomonas sp. TaxID=306 RepID=UPI003FD86CFC